MSGLIAIYLTNLVNYFQRQLCTYCCYTDCTFGITEEADILELLKKKAKYADENGNEFHFEMVQSDRQS